LPSSTAVEVHQQPHAGAPLPCRFKGCGMQGANVRPT
jgi:hypothetical protein